jgi:hypothetical protein
MFSETADNPVAVVLEYPSKRDRLVAVDIEKFTLQLMVVLNVVEDCVRVYVPFNVPFASKAVFNAAYKDVAV